MMIYLESETISEDRHTWKQLLLMIQLAEVPS